MKKNRKRFVVLSLAAAMGAMMMTSSLAAPGEIPAEPSVGVAITYRDETLEQKLKEAQKKREEYEQKRRKLLNEQNNLKAEYQDIEKYIADMDQKQSEIMLEISALEDELVELNAELEVTNQQLAEATEVADRQYENMCRRFQYLYEHGNISELEMIMGSRNISDILNYDEYTLNIREYDYQLVQRYLAAKRTVELVKEKLEAQIAMLDASHELYEQDFAYAQEVIAKKQEALADFETKIGANQEVLEEYLAEYNKANKDVIALQKEIEKERARAAAEAAKKQESINYGNVPKTGYNNADGIPKKDEKDPSKMIWPLPGDPYRGSGFGPRRAPTKGASTFHKGVDIGGKYGAQIVAALAGTVTTASYNNSAGNYVEINHGNGYVTRYLHCSKLLVSKGDYVLQGQVIALVGSTGVSTSPHLHFSVVIDGTAVDPLRFIRY